MNIFQTCRRSLRRAAKCTAVLTATAILTFQPCFSFAAQAADGTELFSSLLGLGDNKLTNISMTYADGTKYTADYKYNTGGQLIYAHIKAADGSYSTYNRTYLEGRLSSESGVIYNADEKTETSSSVEYSIDEELTHSAVKSRYPDGTTESQEAWYLDKEHPTRETETETDGTTSETNYTYNEQGEKLTVTSVSSDGTNSSEEWRYDENGDFTYYRSYDLDAGTQIISTSETAVIGEDASKCYYNIDITNSEDGQYKQESWSDFTNENLIKRITTAQDGSQSTETYGYDSEGREILYTKTGAAGQTTQRKTSYSHNGKEISTSSSDGSTYRYSSTVNDETGETATETVSAKKDGSSHYLKIIYDYYDSATYRLEKDKNADGTETSSETAYNEYGESTTVSHWEDGSVSTDVKDASGVTTSYQETAADGTYSQTFWEKRADGRTANEVTLYSDGSQDRIDYEYDEAGTLIKETEVRRNGVTAVSLYQYDADSHTSTETDIFNNGLRIVQTYTETDDDRMQDTYTYSAGDIAEDTVIYENDIYTFRVIYRDGHVEETSIDTGSYENYSAADELYDLHDDRLYDFADLAWTILPQ